ncbi:MAG: pyridoxine 5'-phosphate synthase [Bacteroidia bacterium]|nr:MAG: pyridoxine 5'-phosphate synthase [Bacteroidia bacterium]
MVKLSVNINKVALLRNSRGENYPNLIEFAKKCLDLGAHGITVHPRPDERHIKYADVYELRPILLNYKKEFNIEGYPSENFIQLITEVCPDQCTLVPDPPHALTSNTGWDTRRHFKFLKEVITHLRKYTRVSLFLNCDNELLRYAKELETDRIELYTGPYAKFFPYNPHLAIQPYIETARLAQILNIEVNAGHDLNSENLKYFVQNIPNLKEVSIGHAIISESLYLGIEETIKKYINCLKTT